MIRATRRNVLVIACVLAGFDGSAARAAAVIAGTHVLAPNMPGQQVPILVTGSDAVSGIDFFIQVGDGGTTVGGDDTGPRITQVDLVSGTIFASNNTGVFLDPAPLIWGATTTTATGSVSANGVLATLTIDTTGMFVGQFDLVLNPPSTGPTAFADPGITTSLINGSLSIGDLPPPGDHNQDGAVNAADYVVWRKTDGSPAGYDLWRTNFGRTAGGGSHVAESLRDSDSVVPEPASVLIVLVASLAGACRRRPAATWYVPRAERHRPTSWVPRRLGSADLLHRRENAKMRKTPPRCFAHLDVAALGFHSAWVRDMHLIFASARFFSFSGGAKVVYRRERAATVDS
jgi:hypothetical protein